MSFNSKRGRPKKTTPTGSDLGTPELVYKRAMSLTTEALDLCLERNIITSEQHWCGVHLRWLYTLRYGAPTVRAVDQLHFGGRELVADSPEWRLEREREYNEAMQELGTLAMQALALCVYNQRPACLRFSGVARSLGQILATLPDHEREMEKLQSGLDKLVGLWCKRRKPNRHPVA